MGYGMGIALSGAGLGIDDQRRRVREDFQMEQAQKQADRADTTFKQQQEDRAFGLPYQRKTTMRQDEISDLETEIKKNELEIARTLQSTKNEAARNEAAQRIAQLEHQNYGLVYQAYKTRGGRAAAQLFNRMRGNGIENAADMIVVDDTKSGKKLLRIVDANGQVVSDPKQGPAEFPLDALEKAFGQKPEKGRYNESERGITDTATGTFKPHGPDVPGAGGDAKVDPFEKELRAIIFPQWGSQLGERFVFDGDNGRLANEHLRLAVELANKAGNKRNAARYAEEAGKIIRAQKARGNFKGELPGAGGVFKRFDPSAVASKMRELFPQGNEAEMRQFMKERGIDDPGRQDQVLQRMGMRGASKATTRPVAKKSLPSGVSKEQALQQAKAVAGSATPEQKLKIRERLMGWGITDAEMKAAGL